jgi:HD-like signal output (HDOD) protein
VVGKYEHLKETGFDLTAQWKHSILVAQACHGFGRRSKARLGLAPDELYVCGLLHDLGKVVLLDCLRQDYVDVVKDATQRNVPVHVAEEERLGFTHTDVGQIVAQQWSLPPQIEHAIQHHHAAREVLESDPVVALVASVDALVHRVVEGNRNAAATAIDARMAKVLGVAPTDVTGMVEFVEKARGTIVV